MRQALVRVDTHNPLVEQPRPGFCVETPQGFVCAYEDREGDAYTIWRGGRVGYCKASGKVRVWPAFYSASECAIIVGGRVTTPPRIAGECAAGPVRVWEDAHG
jgi:hypothetical protein